MPVLGLRSNSNALSFVYFRPNILHYSKIPLTINYNFTIMFIEFNKI